MLFNNMLHFGALPFSLYFLKKFLLDSPHPFPLFKIMWLKLQPEKWKHLSAESGVLPPALGHLQDTEKFFNDNSQATLN